MSKSYTPALRNLLSRAIVSVEQVEVLLLLRRAPDVPWTAEAISAELRSSVNSVRRRLADLLRAKLIEQTAENLYRYRPSANGAAVDELAHEYEVRRVRLIEAIFSRPSDAVRSFADAFRLREDEDDR